MKKKLIALVSAVISGAVSLTACGSGSSASDTLSANEPVKIMVIAPLTGRGGLLVQIPAAVKAAADQINSQGGLKGHPIEVLTCDEQYSPNVATQCATKAAQERVIASVGSYSNYSNAFYPAFEKAGIVNLGNHPITDPDFTHPLSYPIVPGFPGQGMAAGVLAGKQGCKSLVAISTNIAVALEIADLIKKGAQSVNPGMTVTEPITVGSPQEDYAPIINQAAARNADCISLLTIPQDTIRIMTAIQASGHKMKVFASTAVFTPKTLKSIGPAADGKVFVAEPQSKANNSPELNTIAAAIKKQNPSAQLDSLSLDSWGAVQVLKLAAEHMTSFTSRDLSSALRKIGTVDLGFYAPFSFAEPNAAKSISQLFNTTSYGWVAKGGEYVPLASPNPPLDVGDALAKAEGK